MGARGSLLPQSDILGQGMLHAFVHPIYTFVSGLDLSKVRHTVDVCLIIQQQVKQNKPPWLPGRDIGIMGSFRLEKTSRINESNLLTLT